MILARRFFVIVLPERILPQRGIGHRLTLGSSRAQHISSVFAPEILHSVCYNIHETMATKARPHRTTKRAQFERAMAQMARDPSLRRESSKLNREFQAAEGDGL